MCEYGCECKCECECECECVSQCSGTHLLPPRGRPSVSARTHSRTSASLGLSTRFKYADDVAVPMSVPMSVPLQVPLAVSAFILILSSNGDFARCGLSATVQCSTYLLETREDYG